MEENKIIIYQTEDGQTQIDVRLENDTVWLTQAQMAELFQKTPQNITMHIRNAYSEGELEKEVTCKEYLQVQTEGNLEDADSDSDFDSDFDSDGDWYHAGRNQLYGTRTVLMADG